MRSSSTQQMSSLCDLHMSARNSWQLNVHITSQPQNSVGKVIPQHILQGSISWSWSISVLSSVSQISSFLLVFDTDTENELSMTQNLSNKPLVHAGDVIGSGKCADWSMLATLYHTNDLGNSTLAVDCWEDFVYLIWAWLWLPSLPSLLPR
jgi:hypothetical protein